jgi:acylphosphatase
MPNAARSVRHVTIKGHVQGVWYRGWTVESATALGLHGWVRNRPDGTVEAVFAGASDALDSMIEACRRGPASARVSDVVVTDIADEGWTDFVQRATL